ncbi:MAG: glutathione S-transferase family protein [Rhodocyclaceae bacterium]|nr:glutathione S-transferase family protein [Rhodocyclaceae bacterium]MCB1911921.1 glutathione S-transferase family protein [Rhodocyclaceae bacterium]MCP5233507.1 glutathione S-transferase family protein [Zoogloeaceae bacterium]MCP5241743.1 glutathione S-transferase family protein [Zoogloeaceae bacterium]MCW5617009.1 glutathione S-transferase family protein [Rhodocyclaceae bacterium]
MQLIGMLDSPFVRRTFITARLLEIPFEHRPLSIFRNFSEVHSINPLVKVPILVFNDGETMVDSGLIIEYFEESARTRTLMPAQSAQRRRCRRLNSFGLALAEKSVQLYYEIGLRPQQLRWDEWITRQTGQLRDGAALIESEIADASDEWLCGREMCHADVTLAVAWRFSQFVLPHILEPELHPRLAELSARAEELPAFKAAQFE